MAEPILRTSKYDEHSIVSGDGDEHRRRRSRMTNRYCINVFGAGALVSKFWRHSISWICFSLNFAIGSGNATKPTACR
jgi:hypothetical protein